MSTSQGKNLTLLERLRAQRDLQNSVVENSVLFEESVVPTPTDVKSAIKACIYNDDFTNLMIPNPDVSKVVRVPGRDREPWTSVGQFATTLKVSVGPHKEKKILRVWTSEVKKDLHNLYQDMDSYHDKMNGLSECFSIPKVNYFSPPTYGFAVKKASYVPYVLMDLVYGHTLDDVIQRTYSLAKISKKLRLKVLAHLEYSIAQTLLKLFDGGITHGDLSPRNIMVPPLEKMTSIRIALVDLDSLQFHGVNDKSNLHLKTIGHPEWKHPDFTGKGDFSLFWNRYSDFVQGLLFLITLRSLSLKIKDESNILPDHDMESDWDGDGILHSKDDLIDFNSSSSFKILSELNHEKVNSLLYILSEVLGPTDGPPHHDAVAKAHILFLEILANINAPTDFTESEVKKYHKLILEHEICDFCEKPFEEVFFKNDKIRIVCECEEQIRCGTCGLRNFEPVDRNGNVECATCNHIIDSNGKCILKHCFACSCVTVQCKTCRKIITDIPDSSEVFCSQCSHFINLDGECMNEFCQTCHVTAGKCKTCGEKFPVMRGVTSNYHCETCEHLMDDQGECQNPGPCMACRKITVECSTCSDSITGYYHSNKKGADDLLKVNLFCETCEHSLDDSGNCTMDVCFMCDLLTGFNSR